MLLGISLGPASPFQGESMAAAASLQDRWPVLAAVPPALAWLGMRADLGIAPRTLDAYARGLSEYLAFCAASCPRWPNRRQGRMPVDHCGGCAQLTPLRHGTPRESLIAKSGLILLSQA